MPKLFGKVCELKLVQGFHGKNCWMDSEGRARRSESENWVRVIGLKPRVSSESAEFLVLCQFPRPANWQSLAKSGGVRLSDLASVAISARDQTLDVLGDPPRVCFLWPRNISLQ